MKIATISILICCIWTVSSAIQPQEQTQRDERTTIQGDVEAVEGSPVVLSDARYELARIASDPQATKVIGHVKIENVSGRPIRVLHLVFAFKVGFNTNAVAAAFDLGQSETRDYVLDNMTWRRSPGPAGVAPNLNGMTLNVMPTGAEFKDGSHWAAPRTESRLWGRFCLNKAGAYVLPRGCQADRAPYGATFEVVDPAVVAYRLGMVTDTPSSFEVRLGEWAYVAESERHRGGRVVEPGGSLKADQMLSTSDANTTTTQPAGAAIFVAELRFADGHVWRQDTRREELLWDY